MKKMDNQKTVRAVLWLILFLVGNYIFIKGTSLDKEVLYKILVSTQETAVEIYLPGILGSEDETENSEKISRWMLNEFEKLLLLKTEKKKIQVLKQDEETVEKIVRENSDFLQVKLQEENQEAGPAGGEGENTDGVDLTENQNDEWAKDAKTQDASADIKNPVTDIALEKFQDFDFVMKNFFTVDKTTSINSEQLNAPVLVEKDMRMAAKAEEPQILIYHSHSQEAFVDSLPGEQSETIVGVGEYLTSLLRDTYGYNVIHIKEEFDMVNGQLDRNKAYTFAQERISQVLNENPNVEVVIDLHRDGVPGDRRLVTEINGKPTAKIMFFNGLSRTNQNGEITYLPNPYIQDNLAFSFQLMLESRKLYPDFARTIYLRGYRYNLHLRPKALLVECGAQTNTVEEEKNAMEPFAEILNKVLKGE